MPRNPTWPKASGRPPTLGESRARRDQGGALPLESPVPRLEWTIKGLRKKGAKDTQRLLGVIAARNTKIKGLIREVESLRGQLHEARHACACHADASTDGHSSGPEARPRAATARLSAQ